MKGLDLSKFKKVSSDKSCTTLKHPDGHTIKIAHLGLKPKMREELNKLPVHKASGGMIHKYAEGTPDEPVSSEELPQDQPAPQPQAPVVINVGAAQSAPAPQMPQSPPEGQAVAPQAAQQTQSNNQEPLQIEPSEDQSASPKPAMPAQPPMAKQDVASSQPQAQMDQIQDQGDEPTDAAAPAQEQQAAVPVKQELAQEDKAWEQDLANGHITPKTYSDLFADKGTLGKIGMIFGLILGGAGSGLTHQPNAALQMMQNEIDRDLEAQKKSKDNAQNYLRLGQANELNNAQIQKMKQEGKLTDQQAKQISVETNAKSYALAQTRMLQTSYHSLVTRVNKMPEGPLKEQAKQQLGMIYSKMGERINDINDQAAGASEFYKTLFGQNQPQSGGEQAFQQRTTGMRMLGPQGEARAKDMEEKHFPGLQGQASIPLNSDDRTKINSGIDFDQKLHRFMDWTKNHSGDLNPQDRNAGQAMAAELQGAYRQATAGGVYKEGEQNFISKLIDSHPTKFFNEIRVMPQLKAIANENQSRVNQLVKSKGFEGYKNPSNESAKQVSSPDIKLMNGIKYKKVNSGWQKVE